MKKYYVYIARCIDDTYYTGYTVNLRNREDKHNKGKGAKYTKQRRPVRIVYFEQFKTIREAMKREAQIKKWSRSKKKELINKPS